MRGGDGSFRESSSRRRQMTPELATTLVDAVIRTVGALDRDAGDYVPEEGKEFMQRDTLRMRMIALSVCDSMKTAASLVNKTMCEPFTIASYFEQARNGLREYERILSRHALVGNVLPKYQPYADLYDDLTWLVWEVGTGRAGYYSKCQCNPK